MSKIAECLAGRYRALMTHPTFNLTALSDRLFREKRHMKLAGLIRDAVRHHSVRTDLIIAQECCEALEAIKENPLGGFHQSTIEQSLLHNAILLYTRATKTDSTERKPVDILHIFTDDQRGVHAEITQLRDDAVAHFGPGGSYDGIWKAELCLLQINEQGRAKAGVPSRRIALDRHLIGRISSQIAVALAYIDPLAVQKIDAIVTEIDVVAVIDPDLDSEIARHPLNLEVFLASTNAADEARRAYDVGYAKGVTGHR